jgi:hypothetical protein
MGLAWLEFASFVIKISKGFPKVILSQIPTAAIKRLKKHSSIMPGSSNGKRLLTTFPLKDEKPTHIADIMRVNRQIQTCYLFEMKNAGILYRIHVGLSRPMTLTPSISHLICEA